MSTQLHTEDFLERQATFSVRDFVDFHVDEIKKLGVRGAIGSFIGTLGFVDIAKEAFNEEPDIIKMSKGGLKVLAAIAISSTGKR